MTTRRLDHVLLEHGALVVFLVYTLALLQRVLGSVGTGGDGLVLLLGLGLGYLLADLISGIAHWIGDRFGDENTPFVGPRFIAPFREHHDHPGAMVQHGVVELVGNTAILATPCLAVAYYRLELEPGASRALFGGGLVLMSMVGVVATNLFHRWAHMDRPPALARLLQRAGLVLTSRHHARHHAGSFDRAYCITTGWMDGILDGLRVWERLEALLGRGRRAGDRQTGDRQPG